MSTPHPKGSEEILISELRKELQFLTKQLAKGFDEG